MRPEKRIIRGLTAAALAMVITAASAAVFCAFSVRAEEATYRTSSAGEDVTEGWSEDLAGENATGGKLSGETTSGENTSEGGETSGGRAGLFTLDNVKTGKQIAAYDLKVGDTFSIGFIHSVNKSPVTDYYELREDGIYVVKTVYYGFGAGVQTELEEGETLTYGEDGSMIITGFNRKMEDLIYFVGTVSDHTMVINEGREDEQQVSLRDLCGRNAMVRFAWEAQGDALTD